MVVASEVIDSIDLVFKALDAVQKFVVACNAGAAYLKTNHPEAREDLTIMCKELRKTVRVLSEASRVVTNFHFVTSGSGVDTEPARFNDYFVRFDTQAKNLKSQLEDLRGHCTTIHNHAKSMEGRANSLGLRLFQLLNIQAARREQELSDALREIYDQEMEYVAYVEAMDTAVNRTMKAVQDALGPTGPMAPGNVLYASQVLEQHADLFDDLDRKCEQAEQQLRSAIKTIE